MHTRTARRMVEIAARTIWGADSGDISLLYALWYVRAAGGFDPLIDVEGGAQQDRFVGGSQLISLRMAGGARRAAGAGGARVAGRAGRARAWSSRPAGSGWPPGGRSSPWRRRSAQRIEFEPELPPARTQLAQRMPWGSYIKCIAVYDEPFWRADGLSGEGVSDAGPATTTFDNCPPDGVARHPARVRQRRRGSGAPAPGRRRAPRRRARGPGAPVRAEGPRHRSAGSSRTGRASATPAAARSASCPRACGPATAAPLREPVGPIHWAGTETSEVWSGYMDGAVRSGERAAAEALAAC